MTSKIATLLLAMISCGHGLNLNLDSVAFGMAPSRQMLAQLDKQLLSLAQSNSTPELAGFIAQVQNLINSTMKANVRTRHANEQAGLNASFQEYSNCNVTELDLDAVWSAANAHTTCRNQQQDAWTNYSNCTSTTNAAQAVQNASCNVADQLNTFPDVNLCNNQFTNNPNDLKHVSLKAEANRFRSLIAQLQNATANCTNYTWDCTAEELAYNSTLAQCNTYQTTLETASCSVANSCTTYDTCWSNANTTYHIKMGLVNESEDELKAEWQALLRIECLIVAITSANKQAEIDTCKNKNYDVSEMDLTYYSVPNKLPCTHPAYLTPSTQAFADKWFENITNGDTVRDTCEAAFPCCSSPNYP